MLQSPVLFKLDENLPLEARAILRDAGHDALSVVDQGLGGAPDISLDRVCQEEGRTLITLDLDFSDIRLSSSVTPVLKFVAPWLILVIGSTVIIAGGMAGLRIFWLMSPVVVISTRPFAYTHPANELIRERAGLSGREREPLRPTRTA